MHTKSFCIYVNMTYFNQVHFENQLFRMSPIVPRLLHTIPSKRERVELPNSTCKLYECASVKAGVSAAVHLPRNH